MNSRNISLLFLLTMMVISLHALQTNDLMYSCNARAKDPRKITTDGNRDIFGNLISGAKNSDKVAKLKYF